MIGASIMTKPKAQARPQVEQLEDRLAPSIDFHPWKLTLPTGPPTEIQPAQLVSGYQDAPYFTQSTSGTTFFAPVNGSHTANSSYARSELREMNLDGTLAAWRLADGTATMRATLKVEQVPSTGKVVVGQVHFGSNPLVKLLYDPGNGGELRALVRDKPGDSASPSTTLATGIKPGQTFDYKLYTKLTPAGNYELRVQVNGVLRYVKRLDPVWGQERFYFKAGSYPQDNTGPSSEGGKVAFSALTVKHTTA